MHACLSKYSKLDFNYYQSMLAIWRRHGFSIRARYFFAFVLLPLNISNRHIFNWKPHFILNDTPYLFSLFKQDKLNLH